jgi:hypothetical protein
VAEQKFSADIWLAKILAVNENLAGIQLIANKFG